jgi:transketolase
MSVTDDKIQELEDIANKLRIHSIDQTTAANSGHPTSCASAAEVMSVLFFHVMRYTSNHNNDLHVIHHAIRAGNTSSQ